MMAINRRKFVAGAVSAAAFGSALAVPARAAPSRSLILNDASRLNPTPMFSHWIARPSEREAFVERLRDELREAKSQNRPVCVGAARHSMGGQSLVRDGRALTFDINRCEIDTFGKTYRVHAGTRWFEVIAHLDNVGFSPVVMQSNSDFGVASTFSVNAHGWPTPHGPFGSTVQSFRMMLADGAVVTCSLAENPELFGLVMGGYGLFGIILDLDVEMTPNLMLKPTFARMDPLAFADRFIATARSPDTRMIYGRLSVARRDFFSEAILVSYHETRTPAAGLPPATHLGKTAKLAREIYRAQIGSEAAKKRRWYAETMIAPSIAPPTSTRNSLMNEPVSNLQGRDRNRTDLLHEYFVAPDRFGDFIKGCRQIIPKARAEFLNVTLRYVLKDEASVLSYAKTDRIAAVMSFSQEMSVEGEEDMIHLTESMIDMVIGIGGSFYLPYRLHARRDQVAAVYPNIEKFVAAKRRYDPNLLFRNQMWNTYFSA